MMLLEEALRHYRWGSLDSCHYYSYNFVILQPCSSPCCTHI